MFKLKSIILFLISFFLGSTVFYLFIYVNSSFINQIGAKNLPYAYIITSLISGFFLLLSNLIEKLIGFRSSFVFLILLIVIALICNSNWLYNFTKLNIEFRLYSIFVLYWISAVYMSQVFWKLFNSVLNVDQRERQSGVISSGETIASLVGSPSVYLIIKYTGAGVENLLGLAILSGILFLILSFVVARLANFSEQEEKGNEEYKVTPIIKSYSFWTFTIFSAVMVIAIMADYSLLLASAESLGTASAGLAEFLGVISATIKLFEVIFKFFLSRFIINRYGIFGAIYVFAGILIALFFSGSLTNYASFPNLLVLAGTIKVFERALNKSLFTQASNNFFLPLNKRHKSIVQNINLGISRPLGMLVGGVAAWGLIKYHQNIVENWPVIRFFFLIGLLFLLIMVLASKRFVKMFFEKVESYLRERLSDTSLESEAELDFIEAFDHFQKKYPDYLHLHNWEKIPFFLIPKIFSQLCYDRTDVNHEKVADFEDIYYERYNALIECFAAFRDKEKSFVNKVLLPHIIYYDRGLSLMKVLTCTSGAEKLLAKTFEEDNAELTSLGLKLLNHCSDEDLTSLIRLKQRNDFDTKYKLLSKEAGSLMLQPKEAIRELTWRKGILLPKYQKELEVMAEKYKDFQ